MAKRPKRTSKTRRAVRPPVIDLKAEESKSVTADAAKSDAPKATSAVNKAAAADVGKADAPKATAAVNKPAAADATASKPPKSETSKSTPQRDAPVAAAAGGQRNLIAAGLVFLVLGGALLGGWLYRGYGAKLFGAPQMASLTAVEDRISALEAAAKADAGKLETLSKSVASANSKIAALETTISGGQEAGKQGLAAVQKSVAELHTALAAASGQDNGAGQAANKIEIDKLTAKLTAVGERIASAETALKDAAKPADTSGLESKLAAIEAELGALKVQQSQLATQTRSELGEAFAKLSGRLAGSGPFGAELDALAAEAPAVPGIEVLRPLATTGVISAGELAGALDKMAASIGEASAAAAEQATSEGGIMVALKAKLSTVVKIRKLDQVDWPAVLAKAAEQIRAGQLAQALELIGSQPGEAPEGLADWRKMADIRVKANRAMDLLSRAVLSRLAATGQTG